MKKSHECFIGIKFFMKNIFESSKDVLNYNDIIILQKNI